MAASAARHDVDLQLLNDRDHGASPATLRARMAAVLEAEAAVAREEDGAGSALRQALVDIAAAAELLAESMEAPIQPRRRWSATRR